MQPMTVGKLRRILEMHDDNQLIIITDHHDLNKQFKIVEIWHPYNKNSGPYLAISIEEAHA